MHKPPKLICLILIITMLSLNIVWPTKADACWWFASQAWATTSGGVGQPTISYEELNKGKCQGGEPVVLYNGNYSYETQDLFIPSRGQNIEIKRYYRSQSRFNSRFGFGWSINYYQKLIPLSNGDVEYLNGKLERLTFGYINGTDYISPAGVYDKLVQNPDGTFTLTTPHGQKSEFDVNGCLVQITDRNSNTVNFNYDAAGLLTIIGISPYSNDPTPKIIAYDYELTQITDPTARSITLTYDTSGHLNQITDFAGRTHTYIYDPSGNADLISYTTPPTSEYPNGNTTTYTYEGHKLTSITDAKNQTYLVNQYDSQNRVSQQTYGEGVFNFSYDTTNHKTTVTDPKGFITEWTYDIDGTPLSKKEYTANLRPQDPDFYLTNYQYNNYREEISIIYPAGNGIVYTYDEYNPDFQKKGNLLEIRRCQQQFTNNLALGKPASASGQWSSQFPASAVVDGVITEPTQTGYWLLPQATLGWVQVDLQAVYDITTIRWLNTHNSFYNDRATINWHIAVSVNGTNFTTVANGTESFSPSPTWVIREIPTIQCRYVRFYVDSYYMAGGGVNEIEVYSESDDDLITAFTYEPNFNLIKTITDPEGNLTTYTYDYELEPTDPRYAENGNLVTITYPEVNLEIPETNFYYNQYGQLTKIIDPNNNTTEYQYYLDTGYLHKIIQDPQGINAITEFTYDSVGNITSVKNARGNTTSFEFNQLNQLTNSTSPAPFNYQTKYYYDENGNLKKLERQANSQATEWQTTEYTYTILDQLETIKQYLTTTNYLLTTFSYDLNGNRASVIDANNKTTTYQYDERNLIWKTTEALNNTTEYTYDLNGNLNIIKDARNNQTTYDYDGFDRLETTTYADSSFAQYTYDKNSNLTNLTNPTNQTINYTYDALNRLDLKTYPDLTIVDYIYDLGSRLTSIQNPASSISYQYDAVNRISSASQIVNSQLFTVNYQYDQIGNRTQLAYPSGTILTYAYDELNRLTDINNLGNHFTYTYDVLSRRTRLDMPNSTFTEYTYDNLNRLITLRNRSPKYKYIPFAYNADEHRLKDTDRHRFVLQTITDYLCPTAYADPPPVQPVQFSGVFSLFNYSYDDVGNRTSALHQIRAGQITENYGYDDIYQLTSNQSQVTSNQYDYDSVGNREVVTQNSTPTNYTTNNLNQYSQVGTTPYQYDPNGNLTNDGTNTYTYDAENRLITSTNNQLQTTNYSYDGLGRRVSKNVNGTVTYYIYDGDRIIEERDANNQLIANYVYGTGIDEVLQMSRNNQVYYYHYDGLGSVSDITDTNGYVVENYSYDAYGMPSQLSTIGNRYYFTGREYDQESGLYYYRNRYYNPTIGRFISRDPLSWDPSDRRILAKSTNLSEILLSVFGADSPSEVEKKKVEQDFLLNNQLMPSFDYFADFKPGLRLDADIIKLTILKLGQLLPQLSVNKYNYAFNSPINYVDSEGEIPHIVIVVVAGVLVVVILVETIVYYVNEVLQKEMPYFPPGPGQRPYQPLNPMNQGPTGGLPCGK